MRFILFFIGIFLLAITCQRQMPTQKDGRLTLRFLVADTSDVIQIDPQLGYAPLPNTIVTLESRKYYTPSGSKKKYYTQTDNLGYAEFLNLPVAEYSLSVIKDTIYTDPETNLSAEAKLTGSKLISMVEDRINTDTLKTQKAPNNTPVINEIYYCGAKNSRYFNDQYIELYNPADTTVYLDGKILCRGLQRQKPDQDIVNYVQVIYVYQFPGEPKTGRSWPLAPHEFTVIAQDAYDHSQFVATAIDLSMADWEFYNPYKGDIDNAANNVTNAVKENSTDFMINLVHNDIILADGSDFYFGEVSEYGYQYIHIPIETVIDGVEYSANPEKQKELTKRVDAGLAGVGIAKYTGKSTERRTPGFDTNNSSIDFVVLEHPTPGYQHE